jgi:hypothetical protein
MLNICNERETRYFACSTEKWAMGLVAMKRALFFFKARTWLGGSLVWNIDEEVKGLRFELRSNFGVPLSSFYHGISWFKMA